LKQQYADIIRRQRSYPADLSERAVSAYDDGKLVVIPTS
jgi:hypothetical protein